MGGEFVIRTGFKPVTFPIKIGTLYCLDLINASINFLLFILLM